MPDFAVGSLKSTRKHFHQSTAANVHFEEEYELDPTNHSEHQSNEEDATLGVLKTVGEIMTSPSRAVGRSVAELWCETMVICEPLGRKAQTEAQHLIL